MPEKVYLDDSGNPIQKQKVYLDDQGEPISMSAAPPIPPPPSFGSRVLHGLSEAGSEAWGLLKGAATFGTPTTPAEAATFAFTGPMGVMSKKLAESTIEKGKSTAQAFREGQTAKGVLGAAATLNPMSPDVTRLYEQSASGDVAGAAGRGLVDIAALTMPEWGPPAARAASTGARRATQEILNIGPRLTAKASVKAEALNKAAVEDYQQALAAHREKLATVKGRNDAAAKAFREKAIETLKENSADLEEHQATVKRLNEINEARQAQSAEARNLINDVTTNAAEIAKKTKDLEATAREVGNDMFDQVRAAVEGDVANPEPIRAAVEHAKKRILTGSEESLKIFESILEDVKPPEAAPAKLMGEILPPDHPLYRSLVEQGAIEGAPAPTPMTFRDLQGYYTELGMKASTGKLPGDVYQALKYVREKGIGSEMDAMAARHGATEALAEARAYWRDFQHTFHDMKAVATGGSPIARVFRAPDPDTVVAQLTGVAKMRGIKLLDRYAEALDADGAPAFPLAGEISRLAKQTVAKYEYLRSVPKTVRELKIPKQPALKDLPAQPTPRPLPKPPEAPAPEVVDPEALKVAKIEEIANKLRGEGGWGLFSDVLAMTGVPWALVRGKAQYATGLLAYPVGRRVAAAAIERPRLLRWLSKPTPAEITRARKASSLPPATERRAAAPRQAVDPLIAKMQARGITYTDLLRELRDKSKSQVERANAFVKAAEKRLTAMGVGRPVAIPPPPQR